MDSEQDDTEYILMQIQNSKESITVRKPLTCVVKFFKASSKSSLI